LQRTPLKPATDITELGRRTTRGYRNPNNYQLRMLLIAGGLDASTLNYEEPAFAKLNTLKFCY